MKKINVIDQNNKQVSNEVQKEVIKIDKRFVQTTQPRRAVSNNHLLSKNGRIYKKIDKQYGMYADNGEVFKLWKNRLYI